MARGTNPVLTQLGQWWCLWVGGTIPDHDGGTHIHQQVTSGLPQHGYIGILYCEAFGDDDGVHKFKPQLAQPKSK